MKILLTGSNGSLASLVSSYFDCIALDVGNRNLIEYNLKESLNNFSNQNVFVLHFAAETNVDLCEIDKIHAINSNYVLTKQIVDQIKNYKNVKLIFTSSASIFNGKIERFYNEDDEPNPSNFYGLTKYLSEEYIKRNLENYFIFRFGWLIGNPKYDKKFTGKIFNKIANGETEFSGVNDQFGSISFADQFAVDLKKVFEDKIQYGIYNYCTESNISRFDLLKKIVEYFTSKHSVKVKPISIDDYRPKLVAKRPKYELLSNHKSVVDNLISEVNFENALFSFLDSQKKYFDEKI